MLELLAVGHGISGDVIRRHSDPAPRLSPRRHGKQAQFSIRGQFQIWALLGRGTAGSAELQFQLRDFAMTVPGRWFPGI